MRDLRVPAAIAVGFLSILGPFGCLAASVSPADAAVNRYTVQPNSPKPAACNNSGTIPAGTWLQNKPCGYWIGTALAGSAYDVHRTNPSGYHFGRTWGGNNLCAWIPPGALSDNSVGTAAESCSTATSDRISHRRSFGYDFNAAAHLATDGSPISVNLACGAYANYYTSSDYNTGSLRDQVGVPSAEVMYRFTTNGSNPAIVVRDPNAAIGWTFLDRDCVTDWRGIAFHNDDD